MSLAQCEQIASIARDVATAAALIFGAVWSYKLFIQHRQQYPRASLQHTIKHWRIGQGKTLLHVDVIVSNVGDVLISLEEGRTTVEQVLPLPAHMAGRLEAGQDLLEEGEYEVPWEVIGEAKYHWQTGGCEIEPSETQGIENDFILDESVSTVQVYTYLRNETKRPRKLTWDLTTLYDIAD
ncbi:MAG TPA: hypothetical protein ENO24_07660 [Chloroflexi bacterium]|nr:hypothetical protein [Chloroflexota bacterium]